MLGGMHVAVGSIDELWNKWADDLLRYATALVGPDEAPDLVDDAVVKVMVVWQTDPDRRLGLSYVKRVVVNEARMRHRSRSRRAQREWRAADVPAQVELLADPAVLRAVGALSVMQRAAVYLTYWEDLTPSMIAEQLGVSEGTVKRHLSRARTQLRKVLV